MNSTTTSRLVRSRAIYRPVITELFFQFSFRLWHGQRKLTVDATPTELTLDKAILKEWA